MLLTLTANVDGSSVASFICRNNTTPVQPGPFYDAACSESASDPIVTKQAARQVTSLTTSLLVLTSFVGGLLFISLLTA